MEHFYGFNVSGVMTLWVVWGEAVSFEICKMQRIWYCLLRNLDWPPKLRFVPKNVFQVCLFTTKIMHLSINLDNSLHVPAVVGLSVGHYPTDNVNIYGNVASLLP